ncbi:MAG TPA: ATP-binding protein, partial [Myxococcaceae bacterium]|nr:ATP-binding protein [Myxococcaceae bacterium]
RPGGYDAEVIDFLQPVRSAGGDILLGGRQEKERRQAGQEPSHAATAQGDGDTQAALIATQRSEERWRALVQAIPDLIFRMRIDGTYLDFKYNGVEEMLVPPERIIGSNLRDHPLPPRVIEQGLLHLERAIRQGSLQVYEYELEVREEHRYYEWRVVRSGPDEAVCIIRDITERKLAEARLLQQEEELRRHRDSLEALVQSRTQKLRQATLELEVQQAQLIQSEKMASLGQMAAGIVHEINNPVSYVTSNLRTLGECVSVFTSLLQLQREFLALQPSRPQGPGAELLARMRDLWSKGDVNFLLEDVPEMILESQEGTRRIQEIIHSLRSFAREDSGEPELVDVNAELESTLKLVWNELKYKCEVQRDFASLPPVVFHPTQLSQVFANLLINAAQAIETQGEILIQTRLEGTEVVVRISDTGHGMTQETLSKLFMPFFTTKPRGQGTGLGLSISYGIITRHNGRILVESEPGQGSTFTLRLPAELSD